MLTYLRARLREPSTWIGVAVLAASIAALTVWRLHLAAPILASLTAIAAPDHVLATLPRLLIAEWRRWRNAARDVPQPTPSPTTTEPIMADPTFVETLEAAALAGLRAGVKTAITERYGVTEGTATDKLIDDLLSLAEKPGLQAALADLPDLIAAVTGLTPVAKP